MAKISIYATHSNNSKGRLYQEQSRPDVRSCFARDRDRILHSESFRRLKGKTQVFTSTSQDHHRTRMTHTLEVAQIARTIARTLMVDEDLTETIALAHDLGHPPYGHIGEDALKQCMENYGGFEHNEQSLRIVTKLEHRYPTFDGINLSWESLEGILKHNGPITGKPASYISEFNQVFDLQIATYASLEAQIAAIADDVAYNHHDIEDGFRAGLITIPDLYDVAHIGATIDKVKAEYTGISDKILLAEVLRRLMSQMVVDIVETTQTNISKLQPQSVTDIRMTDKQTVVMSAKMFAQTKLVREFLFYNVYRAKPITIKREECKQKVIQLFDYYMNNPKKMYPQEPQVLSKHYNTGTTEVEKSRAVADYVAGMTDRYADNYYDEIRCKRNKI